MSDLTKLLWFHAFNRGDPESIVRVLLAGPEPNRATSTDTYRNEQLLGLEAHVYAYLGRTIDKFGQRALVLSQAALVGSVSPFDTGGLVNKIHPLCGASVADRRAFLTAFSWASSDLSSLIARHPGREEVRAYMWGVRPPHAGPAEVFAERGGAEVSTWAHPENTWQAWTWEGRSTDRLAVGAELQRWTCRPEEYAALLVDLETVVDPAAFDSIDGLYLHGGVSALVAAAAELQAAA